MAVDITGFNRMRREQMGEQKKVPVWDEMSYNDLKAAAKEAGINGYNKMKKEELIEALKSG